MVARLRSYGYSTLGTLIVYGLLFTLTIRSGICENGKGLHSEFFTKPDWVSLQVNDAKISPDGSIRGKKKKPLSDVGKKQTGAFGKSLLIPGWGQLSEGRKVTGYAFLATEIALVSSLIGFRMYSGWLEEDYKVFARQHAGIDSDREHQFYVDIGNWQNRREYNEKRLQERWYDRLYTAPGTAWHWDSEENRRIFKSIRIEADRAGQRSIMMIGGLLLNHLFAAIEATKGSTANTPKLKFSAFSTSEIGLTVGFNP